MNLARHSSIMIWCAIALMLSGATVLFGGLWLRSIPRTDDRPAGAEVLPEVSIPRPGIFARIETASGVLERRIPAPSFSLEANETLDARLAPGPFTVRFTVRLDPGRVEMARFGARFTGGQLIVRRGTEVLLSDAAGSEARLGLSPTWTALTRGITELEYEFVATGDGPAALRAVWRPIESAIVLPLPVDGAPLGADADVRGTQLVRAAACASCHVPERAVVQATFAPAPGPDLSAIGNRARPSWLREWLREPETRRARTNMPALLHDVDDETVEDLVHYLVSRGDGFLAETVPADPSLIATGQEAYHHLGCVACHGALESLDDVGGGVDPSGVPAPQRPVVALGDLASKTTAGALTSFLLDPVSVRPSGVMPDLGLSEIEAQSIAAYLMFRTPEDHVAPSMPSFTVDAQRAARGATAFAGQGCAACHAIDGMTPSPVAAPLETLADAGATGCLADDPPPGAARYGFDRWTREDVGSALALARDARSRAPIPELAVDLLRLRCVNCHAFHGDDGADPAIATLFRTIGEADLGDEGRYPPTLSDAGGRLNASWILGVLGRNERARPWIATRMPNYGAATADMAHGFSAAAGAAAIAEDEPEFTLERAKVGRELVGSNGLNCIQCHDIAGHVSTGTPGPDLALVAGRLRPSFFSRWLYDPSRLVPGTRMPTFYVNGRGAFTDLGGGAADEQIASLWSYLGQGEGLALPDGLDNPEGLELVVSDRPIVLRTYMAEAGVRAIACGFPAQLHVAFDAELCDCALVWSGRFLSAAGAWAGRGGTETNPDATSWTRSAQSTLLFDDRSVAINRRFRGYELDAEGYPTFTYDLIGDNGDVVRVEETPRSTRTASGVMLQRRFELTGPPGARLLVTPGGFVDSDTGGREGFTTDLGAAGRAGFTLELHR